MSGKLTVGRKPVPQVGQFIEDLLHLVRIDNSRIGLGFVVSNSGLKEFENILQTVGLLTLFGKVVAILVDVWNLLFQKGGQDFALRGVLKHMKNTLTHVAFTDLTLDLHRQRIGSAVGTFVEVLRIQDSGILWRRRSPRSRMRPIVTLLFGLLPTFLAFRRHVSKTVDEFNSCCLGIIITLYKRAKVEITVVCVLTTCQDLRP